MSGLTLDLGIGVDTVGDLFYIIGMFIDQFMLFIVFGLALIAAPKVIGLFKSAFSTRRG